MTQRLFDTALRVAVTALILFIAASLLTVSSKVFAQKAAPFDLYDFVNGQYVFRDPGPTQGADNGAFSRYCVRIVLRRDLNLFEQTFGNEVMGVICGGKTSNELEVDDTSGSLAFPQEILQMTRCVEDRPLGYASKDPVCGPWYDVDIVGRIATP